MSYFGKLTGTDLSLCYLNKIESVGLRKAYCWRQIGDLTVSAANVYIFLPYIMAARTAGICHPMYIGQLLLVLCNVLSSR